ncbi:MAG TPA: Gfo/Idh/MocA family oxidoreductase [Sphingobacteriaceae bacterium]
MQQPIVTGLLAYGMSGKIFHAPFLSQHEGFVLKAVTERTKKLAMSHYPDITSYDTPDALINAPDIELVVVNTPNHTHAQYAREALKAGKHVLVDKPFATSVAEAKDVFALAKKTGKHVFVYQNRRYSSDFLSLKQVLESGKLGRIIEVHFRFDRFRNFIGPKAFKETPVPGSGIFYDLGAHLIDQAISLFGRPVSAHKTLWSYRENSQVDDYGTIHLIFGNQVNVFITASMLVADPLPGIVVHGTGGSYIKEFCDTQEEQLMAGMLPDDEDFGIEAPGKEGRLTVMNLQGNKQTSLVASVKGRYMDIFDDVYQAVRGGTPFPVSEEEILTQMELLAK